VALRDQLQECERQDVARPSTLERVCTALIDRDEALRQVRTDLEGARTLASDWETEVVAIRRDNLELHSLLRGRGPSGTRLRSGCARLNRRPRGPTI
jgi:hypothetical protein